tara:strand:- start:2313 stop:3107 length:795 start_codon:yes stop_codon:yes gene_type:complete
MDDKELISGFMECCLSGASKTQVIREYKKSFNLNDEDINFLLDSCSFRKKPKIVNYLDFYKNELTKKCEKIQYPFTQVYKYDNFLSADECLTLIDIINTRLVDSTIADEGDTCLVNDYRTSQSASLGYFEHPYFLEIDKKISDLLNLNPFLGENMQGQKYLPGQYYKEHHDFFTPFTKEYKTYCEWMGQRTWTTMIYLNDVEEGGETYFKHLNLKIKPQQGLLLAWNNLYFNGIPNFKTLHEAMPPIKGDKYVVTKWWRSWSLI